MPKVVVIGAGIVGTALADELTARGFTDVTVLDRGPAVHHRRLDLARARAGVPDQPVEDDDRVRPLHRREVLRAGTPRRLGLQPGRRPRGRHHRRSAGPTCTARPAGRQAWGIEGRLLSPAECVALHPLIDSDRVLGGFHTPADGLAKARARRRGAGRTRHRPRRQVRSAHRGRRDRRNGGRVAGVRTADGVVDADIVVCAAGFWGAQLGQGGRPRRPAGADGAPVRPHRTDRRARRAQHRAVGGRPADPAPPGPGRVLPRARRPPRHRLLQPPADAGRHVHADGRHRGRADAVDAAVHRGGLRARLGRGRRTHSRTG